MTLRKWPYKYSIICIKGPPQVSNKSGLLQVVFKCRFYLVDSRGGVVSVQKSLKAVDCLIQVVSTTGLTVLWTRRKKCGKGENTNNQHFLHFSQYLLPFYNESQCLRHIYFFVLTLSKTSPCFYVSAVQVF